MVDVQGTGCKPDCELSAAAIRSGACLPCRASPSTPMPVARLAAQSGPRRAYTLVPLAATTAGGVRGVSFPRWLCAEPVGAFSSRAAVLWFANLAGAMLHCTLAFVVLIVSSSSGRSVDTPRLPVYLTVLDWNPNGTQVGLVPTLEKAGTLPLTWLTFTFFGLSALAHTTIVVFNWPFGLTNANLSGWNGIIPPRGLYYIWMQTCRQPIRYTLATLKPHRLA